MTNIRLAACAALATVVACGDATVPAPDVTGIRRSDGVANVISHDFPSIQYPSGIANDFMPGYLYVSTLSGARSTYVIDPATSTVIGTEPGSANPRDVVWAWGRGLLYSDMGRYVEARSVGTPAQEPIPWRGGGISHWRDTLYIGDLDSDSILVMHWPPFSPTRTIVRKFPTPTRNEGLVADSTDVIASTMTLWSISPFDGWMTEIDALGNFIRRCNTPYTPGPSGLGGITLLRDTFFLAYPIGGDPLAGTRITRIAKDDLVCAPGSDTIDVDPGHFPNRVTLRSGAPIDVAVYGSVSRPAGTLITSSVRFGPTGSEAAPISVSIRDVNRDGVLDVVYRFRTGDTGIACGDTLVRLTASATSGFAFDATDSILITGPCRP